MEDPDHAVAKLTESLTVGFASGSELLAAGPPDRTGRSHAATSPSRVPQPMTSRTALEVVPGWRSAVSVQVDFEELNVNLSSEDPATGLRASLALHRLAERVEANHVAAAREKGWSWQQIGDALGVTRQSVHSKYNKESS